MSLKSLFKKKTEKELFIEYFNDFKEKYISDEFNPLNFVPFLTEDELNVFIEISNRSDGKTTSSYMFFLKAAIDIEEVKISFICRHYEQQISIKQQIIDIMIEFPDLFDYSKLQIQAYPDYSRVFYDGQSIALIYDLNNASDLKNNSSQLKKNPILLFDEFLTLPSDYSSLEAIKLDLIYSSVDKIFDRKIFKHPKVILLGNPVNFDSEILSSLDIFDLIEETEMNTYNIRDNIFLEMRRNDIQNSKKSKSLFKNVNESNISGQFSFNRFNLINSKDYEILKSQNEHVRIRLDDTQSIEFVKSKTPVIKIALSNDDDEYTIDKKFETDDCTYLTEKFYKDSVLKKFIKNYFNFANSYSKNIIYSDTELQRINYFKLFNSKKIQKDVEEKDFLNVRKFNILNRWEWFE